MPDSLTIDTHLPAQFRGAARLFRDRIGRAVAPAGPAMKALVANSDRAVRRRHGSMPREFLPDLEAKWRQLPPGGQLALDITRTRRNINIVDTRCIPETIGNADWDDGETEPSLIVVQNRYEITRLWARTQSATTACLSLHALGRFMQRARDTSDEALLRDIGALATAAPTLLQDQTPRRLSIPLADGGFWYARCSPFRDVHGSAKAAIIVRTYWCE